MKISNSVPVENRNSMLCYSSWPEVAYGRCHRVVDRVHSQVPHGGGREQILNGRPFHVGCYLPIHDKPGHQ